MIKITQAPCHFSQSNDDFNNHAKFTLIKTITSRNKPTDVIQDIQGKCKNTLETAPSQFKSKTEPIIVHYPSLSQNSL